MVRRVGVITGGRFEGERMVMTPPASEIEGVKVTRELTWERITDQSL